MKTWKLLLWTMTMTAAFSCQKLSTAKTATSTGTSDTSAVFSATIAGTSWTADSVAAVLVYGTKGPFPGKVLTMAGMGGGKLITLTINDTSFSTSTDSTLTITEYTMPQAVLAYAVDTALRNGDTAWVQQLSAETGEATVTNTLTGTFAFTGIVCIKGATMDTIAITNGVFKNIPYTYVKAPF